MKGINQFAFVVHPLDIRFIHKHPWFGWTRTFPDRLIEYIGAHVPPIYLSRITGGQSCATGQRVEGCLFTLGATPHQFKSRGERYTYHKLNQVARLAERRGARILGLGAFTSVVGDAGITVAREADIAITTGNSLTVAATLEVVRIALEKMETAEIAQVKAMVVGATGSIGSACARLLARLVQEVVLVSLEPEKLVSLERRILAETPGAKVRFTTQTSESIPDCDLVITATSAFGQRILDIAQCKPGAVICDVALPANIHPYEADLRPDVLVIGSGGVIIPGDVDIGYDIGLPPRTAYACLAETALLAMEGRFEDYTLGRDISLERVDEVYRLFQKHGFRLAGLHWLGRVITDEDMARKRELADKLRHERGYPFSIWVGTHLEEACYGK